MQVRLLLSDIGKALFTDKNNHNLEWQILIFLPAILCIVLFGGVYAIVNSQAQSRAEMVTDNFQVNCNAMFSEMEIVGDTLKNDSYLQQCLNADLFSYSDSENLCTIIKKYKNESSSIQEIFVISEEMDHIYTSSAFFTLSSLPVLLSQYGITNEIYENFGDNGELHIGYPTLSFYYYTPVISTNGDKIASMIIALDNSAYRELFLNMGNISFCGIYDNNNPDYYICSHIIPVSLNLNWFDRKAMSDFLGESVTLFHLSDDSFTYVIAIPRSSFYRPLWSIIIFFIIYFVIILAIQINYVLHQQKERNQTIDSLISELPDQNIYSDDETVFENVKTALRDYRKQLENTAFTHKSSLLQGILLGYYGNNIPQDILRETGLNNNCSYYYVTGFHILELPVVNEYLIPDAKDNFANPVLIMIQSALDTIAADKFPISFTSTINSYNDCLIVIFFSDTTDKFELTVENVCQELTSLFSRNYGIMLQVTVSDMASGYNELPAAYTQMRDLRDFAVTTANSSAVICQDQFITTENGMSFSSFLQSEQVLLNTLIAKKYDMIPGMVDSILSSENTFSPEQYQLINNRIDDIKNILLEGVYTCDCQQNLKPSSIDALKNAASIPELITAATELYTQINTLTAAETTDVVTLACNYIDENISDVNLTVKGIADAAGVSIRHLTELFKAHFDMTIADYVNHNRIAMAKELLKDPKAKTAHVASQVGYYNIDTFVRNFRKLEGITPTEYRTLILAS